jgi:hypothetical protein
MQNPKYGEEIHLFLVSILTNETFLQKFKSQIYSDFIKKKI